MRLKGKHAFITGSSREIGRGIALRLAREGATVSNARSALTTAGRR
jgi:NAD(P)-dependent dehydrogenase (short-subunit alcohol dehydrogenase family)